jgi:hypothetical protein
MTTPAASGDGSAGSDTVPANPNAFDFGMLLKYMVSLQAKLTPPSADVSV